MVKIFFYVFILIAHFLHKGNLDEDLEGVLSDRDKDFVETFRKAVGVTVTFNYKTGVLGGEVSESMLAFRMLYSHFHRRGSFQDFYESLCSHVKSKKIKSEEAMALISDDIKKDLDKNGRHIILAVDELKMSKNDEVVLKEVTKLISSQTFIIVTHLSRNRLDELKTYSNRTIVPVYLPPLRKKDVDDLIESLDEEVQKRCSEPSVQSIIADTNGIPRLIQFVVRYMQTIKITQFMERSALLSHLADLLNKYVNKDRMEESMICAFCNWRFKTDESKKILEGFRRDGYLHYIEENDAGIPALLFYLW